MTSPREIELADSLTRLLERVDVACRAAGRDRSTVQVLPVTKFFPASDVEILYRLGCRAFGESREQEASSKVASVSESIGGSDSDAGMDARDPIAWHMVGHLQRNKAKSVAAWAHAIHSVDSERLVNALAKATTAAIEAGVRHEPLRVLLQVSLDGDPERGGALVADVAALAEKVAAADALELRGLMAIPPLDDDPERSFEQLAQLHSALLRDHPYAVELSAGMSNDLEVAVQHGSTCVRVGTALMGARPITSDATENPISHNRNIGAVRFRSAQSQDTVRRAKEGRQ